MMAVGEDRGDQEKESHPRGYEHKASVEGLTVCENAVGDSCYNIQKPDIIKHYEKFTEGYDIVNSHMNHDVLGQSTLLKPYKPEKIKSHIQNDHPYAPVH